MSDKVAQDGDKLLRIAMRKLHEDLVNGNPAEQQGAVKNLMPILRERMQSEEESEVLVKMRLELDEFFSELRAEMIAGKVMVDELEPEEEE